MKSIIKKEEGQTLGELVLILLLIVLIAIVALSLFGNSLQTLWNQIANAV